jgi:hypothetical protein
MEPNLVLNVFYQVFFCYLFLAHALEAEDLTTLNVLCNISKPDHSTSDDSTELKTLDVGVGSELMNLRFTLATISNLFLFLDLVLRFDFECI